MTVVEGEMEIEEKNEVEMIEMNVRGRKTGTREERKVKKIIDRMKKKRKGVEKILMTVREGEMGITEEKKRT